MADPAGPTPPPTPPGQVAANDNSEKAIRWDLWVFFGLVALAAAPIIVVYVRLGYGADWTGLGLDTGPTQVPPTGAGGIRVVLVQLPKRLWDWVNLFGVLAVPVAVVIVGGFLARQQAATEREIAAQRQKEESYLANERLKESQVAALDQQQQATLATYLDRISELMLAGRLTKEDASARDVVRVRTLTTLRQLDGARKGIVVRFLAETGLIDAPDPILKLNGVDLQDADLYSAKLPAIDLSGADLSGADLYFADLRGANLRDATLRHATLCNANLSTAVLDDADLRSADLRAARLEDATLVRADLAKAKLVFAVMTNADMSWTDLTSCNLGGAKLHGTLLQGAFLNMADVRGAHLFGTVLRNAVLTGAQWSQSLIPGLILDGATNEGKPVTTADLVALGAIEQPSPTDIDGSED